MNINKTRTTILMEDSLLNRLKLFSKLQNKSVSQIISEAVAEKINEKDSQWVESMYQQVERLADSFKNVQEDPRYKDMGVGEILCGEKGA